MTKTAPLPRLQHALQLAAANDYAGAITLLEREAKLKPNAELFFYLGKFYLQQKQADAAVKALRRAHGLAQDNPNIHYLLGMALAEQGDIAAGAAMLARALASQPHNPAFILGRARLLRQAGDAAQAVTILQAANSQHDIVEIQLELAASYIELGEFPAASEWAGRALRQEPGNLTALSQLASASAALGALDVAANYYRLALAKKPDQMELIAGLAQILAQQGRLDAALNLLENGLNNPNQDGYRHHLCGMLLAAADQPQAALDAFTKAHDAGHNTHSFWINYGLAAMDCGQPDLAATAFAHAEHLQPANLVRPEQRDRQAQDIAARRRLLAQQPAEDEMILPFAPLAPALPQAANSLQLTKPSLYGQQWYIQHETGMAADLVFQPPVTGHVLRAAMPQGNALFTAWPRQDYAGTLIAFGGGSNYYHLLLDYLPRLAHISADPAIKIALYPALPAYAQQLLQLAGFPADRALPIPSGIVLVPDTLHVPLTGQRPFLPSGQPDWLRHAASPQDISWLRDRLLPQAEMPPDSPRRIFLTRRSAKFRRCVNEVELQEIAAKAGFQVLAAEDYSVAQQIALFSRADKVVGVHGAGFANMVFAPAGAGLLELAPVGILPDFYQQLTLLCGQRHQFLQGEACAALRPLGSSFWDFTIAAPIFRDALEKLLES